MQKDIVSYLKVAKPSSTCNSLTSKYCVIMKKKDFFHSISFFPHFIQLLLKQLTFHEYVPKTTQRDKRKINGRLLFCCLFQFPPPILTVLALDIQTKLSLNSQRSEINKPLELKVNSKTKTRDEMNRLEIKGQGEQLRKKCFLSLDQKSFR